MIYPVYPFSPETFAMATLLAVAAFTSRIPGRSAQFVIRPGQVSLVRVAWITIFGSVAYTLVAANFYGHGRHGLLASGDRSARHGHYGLCQGITVESPAGNGDCCTCENGSLEI